MTRSNVIARFGGLKSRKDGSVIVSTKSHVVAAEARIEFLQEAIEKATAPLQEELDVIKAGVDKYVLDNFSAGQGYEDDNVKLTKVVGHRRSWNPDKLRKILPTRLYKLVINVSVNAAKLDELVREGKIDRTKIESAYEETPNAPYVKRTAKNDKSSRGAEDAASLAKALQ